MSGAETAECLGIPEETVKTRLHRARARLQETLLQALEPAAPREYEFHLSRCDRVVEVVFARLGISVGAANPLKHFKIVLPAVLALCAKAGLRRRQPGHGHAEGARAHVVEAEALEEADAERVASMLAAHAELQARTRAPSSFRRRLDQRSDPVEVERDERIPREDARFDVGGQELSRVVA
jgi:hypothetical protein